MKNAVDNAGNSVAYELHLFASTINESERDDFFDSRNRDLWVSEFGRWLIEHQRKQAEQFGASND